MTDSQPLAPMAPRVARRLQMAAEKRERESGVWSDLMKADVRGQVMGTGWLQEIHTIIKNPWMVVLVRTVPTIWGPVEHAAIRTASETELKWRERQKLKDAIFGPNRVGLEVMPPAFQVVDGANMFHMWILPEGVGLPFTL